MGEEEALAGENGGLKVDSGEQTSSWPAMRFDVSPYRTHHFSKQFRAARNHNNFLKGLKWSADGSCFLLSSEDNTLSLFYLLQDGGDYNGYGVSIPEEDSYGASLLVNGGESVYDFCWYPYMSVSDPLTCAFATTTRDHPIHLWDSASGELRCTYRAYDAMDEIAAASSGHRRFTIPDDDDEDKNYLQLKADENCVSLWSFYVTSEENTFDCVASKSNHENVTRGEEIIA